MYQYILVISGAMLVFLVLRLIPLHLKLSTLVYFSVISFLTVILTKFLYTLFSLPMAIGGFFILVILFSYLLGKHLEAIRADNESFRIDSEDRKPISRNELPQHEFHVDPLLSKLAQEKIDEIIDSYSIDELYQEKEKELVLGEKDTITLSETEQLVGKEVNEMKLKDTDKLTEKDSQVFITEDEKIEQISEIEEKSIEEEVYFEARQRQLLVKDDDNEIVEDAKEQLLIRRVVDRQNESTDEIEEHVFDKRSALLEQLEEDLFKRN